jgi:hypothetical protein
VKPLTIKQIEQLRKLVKVKPTPLTPEEQRLRKNARRAQYRADSLAHAQMTWDCDYACLLSKLSAITKGGPTLSPEFVLGERPTVCTPRMQATYHNYITN